MSIRHSQLNPPSLKPNGAFVSFCKEAIQQSLSQRFEQQVKLFPDKIAVKTESGSLTYQELNRAANRIAHALVECCGYKAEPIAILQKQGLVFITTLLGILKAGKFYVPLDLSYDQEKIASILTSARIGLLVTDNCHLSIAHKALHIRPECRLLNSEELVDDLSLENLALPISADTPAYIFYTSGTTGRPKGVVDNHRNVLHNILRYTNALSISPDDRLTLLQAGSFSGSVSNIFGALLNGATLCPFDLQTESMHALAIWLEEEEITIYHSVPAIFRSFPKEGKQFSSIRIIRLEGDQANRRDMELYRQYFSSDCLLVNGLGATECGIVRQYFIGKDTEFPGMSVPIGYATTDMEILLLGEDGQMVDVGQVGEIVVEGDYLAVGYWRDDERTAAAFRSASTGMRRRYYSGDLGRFSPDTCLEYIGRKNFQAKLRGHLIDYGEVEAALLRLDGIAEAVALIREDQPGEQRLVAYLVLAEQSAPTITAIRSTLAQTLSEYMIPSAYVLLDALPVNANKKVDRKALPVPSQVRPVLETAYVVPQTSVEKQLAEMWSHVLHIDRVGTHDNFFELGGNSLLVSRFLVQLHQVCQIELPLREVFDQPTIAQLAPLCAQTRRSTTHRDIKILRRTPGEQFFSASFAQQRLWFLDQLQHGSPVYNISEAYCFKGDLSIAGLEQSLNDIVKRHETLRTTFKTMNGQLTQRIVPKLTLQLPIHDLQKLTAAEREAVSMHLSIAEAQRPFDLETGPLLRVRLVCLTQTEHVLLVTLHHIIADGWSMGIFYQEIVTLYAAYVKRQPSPLADLPIQYADYALWQQEWLQNRVLETQLAYWKQQLAGVPPVLELPIDKPRPPMETFRGAYEMFMLPSSLVDELEKSAYQKGETLFMVLLAAFQILLSYYTRQDDIVLGTDVANRQRAEVEGLIGFFVNQLVLRTDLSGNPTCNEVLQRVRAVVLSAYEHQDVPFDQLVKTLNPVRYPDRAPLFQVKLVLQNVPVLAPLLTITVSPLHVDNGTAQLDLLLAFHHVASGLQGVWQYNTDLFEVETIRRMSQHFLVLLKVLVTSPSHTLSQVKALLDDVDSQQRRSLQRQLAQVRHQSLKTVLTKPRLLSKQESL